MVDDGWSLTFTMDLPILGLADQSEAFSKPRPEEPRDTIVVQTSDRRGGRPAGRPHGASERDESENGDTGRLVRILIADDTPGSRAALQALLATFPGVEVVGEATDGAEALCMCFNKRPDIVLMDVRMPGLNGLQATKLIKSKCPGTGVVVLSMHARYRAMADSVGADAFLLKGCSADALMKALDSLVH